MSFRRFPVRFGKYILLDRLNVGGMAEVYRAKITGEQDFQRLLAIKCMLPKLLVNPSFVNMFIDEAKLAAKLSHPNIVQIYELGRYGDRLYIAMELIFGRDLGHIIEAAERQRIRLPVPFILYVVQKVAEGLDFAHHSTDDSGRPLNLIHRDVSPQNVLVSFDGAVKVVDFGIAKADVRSTHTTDNVIKGKVYYMSPEQVGAGELDKRSDIFSLGSVMYELFTGARLFAGKGASTLSVLEAIRDAAVPPLAPDRADVLPEVESIMRRALAKDRTARFQTADALAEALVPFLIQEGNIYGARQAAAVMESIYRGELASAHGAMRRYLSVKADDCVANVTGTHAPVLFESAFPTGPTRDSTVTVDATVESTILVRPDTQSNDHTVIVSPPPLWDQRGRIWLLGAGVALALTLVTFVVTVISDPAPEAPAPSPPMAGQERVLPPTPGTADLPAPRPPLATQSSPGVPVPATKESTPPRTPGAAVPAVREAKAPAASAPEEESRRKRPPPARWGYISIRADGVDSAKVLIDDAEQGYSPLLARKVRAGRHRVTVIEDTPGGKRKTVEVTVGSSSTADDPFKLVVPLE